MIHFSFIGLKKSVTLYCTDNANERAAIRRRLGDKNWKLLLNQKDRFKFNSVCVCFYVPEQKLKKK